MSKIESGKISLGNSYVLNADGQAKANKEISDAKILADSIIAEAQKKAQATLTQAQQQADSLVAQAKAQAEAEKEQITAESRKIGYEDGYQDGIPAHVLKDHKYDEAGNLLSCNSCGVDGVVYTEYYYTYQRFD